MFMLSRGVSRLSVDCFGLPVLKTFVGNHFNLWGNFGYGNFLCMRTENLVFTPKILCLTIPLKFVVTSSLFGISKTFCQIMIFRRNFCLTLPKNFVRNHLAFQKVSNVRYQKKFMNKNGRSRFSVESFLSQGAEKFRCGSLRYIRKFRLPKNFMAKRSISLFPLNFIHLYCLKSSLGNPSLFQNLWGNENVYAQ